MDSSQASEKLYGPRNKSPESPSVDQSRMRCFGTDKKNLLSTLELLRSHQIVLQAGVNFASLFGVPLTSDLKAAGLGHLFSEPMPRLLEAEQAEEVSIQWSDVVCSFEYEPKLQENGKYRVRIDKGQALVELSKIDHEFIETGIPWQIIDPESYPSDVVSEIETAKSVMAEIAPWKVIAAQLTETINNVLEGLSEKVEALQEGKVLDLRCGETSGGPETNHSPNEKNVNPQTATRGKKRKGGNEWWSPGETSNLPDWFVRYRHLSEKAIEDQYFQFSGQVRSHSALVTKLYQQGYGHLTNKKKKYSPGKNAASEELTALVSPPATETVIDYIQLSQALNLISNWLSSTQKQTAEAESEFENESSSSRDYQRNRSVPHTSEDGPASTTASISKDPNTVTGPINCVDKSATEKAAEWRTGTIVRNEDSLIASPHPNAPLSQSERTERNSTATGHGDPQALFSELSKDCINLDISSLPPPKGDQPVRIVPSYSSSAQIAEDHRRSSSIPSSQKETYSFSTPNEGTTSKNTLENKDLFSMSNKPREITTTTCISGDPASAQNLNFEIAPQSPAPHTIANLSNGSQEPGCISGDLPTDARNESLSVSSAQEIIAPSPHSTADNQSESQAVQNTSCGERKMAERTTSIGRKHEDIHVPSQNERTQRPETFAVQPAHALFIQRPRNFDTDSMNYAPDAKSPPSPRVSQLGLEAETQSTSKPKRAYRRKSKSGCITCRRKRIKCDQHQPTCDNCGKSEILCEGYEAPVPPQIGKALNSRDAVSPRAEQTVQGRIPVPGLGQQGGPGIAVPSGQPTIRQVIHTDNSKTIYEPGSLNETQTPYVGLSPEYTAGAYSQLHSPNHVPSPNFRSLPEKQTISSIQQLFGEKNRQRNPNCVSDSNREWASVNSR